MDSHTEPVLFNSGIAISQNMAVFFRIATDAMLRRDLFTWHNNLTAIYLEGEFKMNRKKKPDDKNEADGESEKIWNKLKSINPHKMTEYYKLIEVHLLLRRYLDKHGFLMPKGDNPMQAVYR